MLLYMLDTSICIYVIKARPPGLHERFNRLATQLCISSITLAELIYGAENRRGGPGTWRSSMSLPTGWTSCPLPRRPPPITARSAPGWSRRAGRPAPTI
jgi:hypothetical protein